MAIADLVRDKTRPNLLTTTVYSLGVLVARWIRVLYLCPFTSGWVASILNQQNTIKEDVSGGIHPLLPNSRWRMMSDMCLIYE